MMNAVKVELALEKKSKWDPAFARPTRNRDYVSAPPDILPSVEDGCLQNVIVDLRETDIAGLPEIGADLVYRVAGVEVGVEAVVESPEVLQALSAGSAWTWVTVSRGKESVVRSLSGGWKRLPENTGIAVRSASLDSVPTWSRVAEDLGLPLRFVYETDPRELSTVDFLIGLGLLGTGRPPVIFGVDAGGAPVKERDRVVDLACSGLREAGLRRSGLQLVACPACARTKVNLRKIAAEVSDALGDIDADLCVAVMGCEVNGPGEARMADIGVACGRGIGLLFREGKVIRRVPEAEITAALLEEVGKMLEERSEGRGKAGK